MCEYVMSKSMAMEILGNRKGDDRKRNPQEYLCKYVNEQFGLKFYCNKVTIVND